MGVFKKHTRKTNEILRAHRLNLEEVCLIFSAPIIRSGRKKILTDRFH